MNIKTISLILIMTSFLAGAFISVLDPILVNWLWYLPVLFFGLSGLYVFRKTQHGEARSSELLSGNMQTLEISLKNLLANLERLNADSGNLPVYEARFEIDRLLREDLNNFANARESMQHVFGLQNYADVMSAFAAGERYVNRVWSASTDGYVDEVHQYLERATQQFREAHDLFIKLKKQFQPSFSTA